MFTIDDRKAISTPPAIFSVHFSRIIDGTCETQSSEMKMLESTGIKTKARISKGKVTFSIYCRVEYEGKMEHHLVMLPLLMYCHEEDCSLERREGRIIL